MQKIASNEHRSNGSVPLASARTKLARPRRPASWARRVPLRNRLFVKLDTNDPAPRQPRDVQTRTARAATNVQHASRRLELEPRDEPIEFLDRQPAVLADILAERDAAHLRIYLSGELPVMSTVMIDNLRPLSHPRSL